MKQIVFSRPSRFTLSKTRLVLGKNSPILGFLFLLLLVFSGCSQSDPTNPVNQADSSKQADSASSADSANENSSLKNEQGQNLSQQNLTGQKELEQNENEEHEHSHTVGPNGGLLAVLGGHEYHLEILANETAQTVKAILSDAEFQPVAASLTADLQEIRLNFSNGAEGKPASYLLKRTSSAPQSENKSDSTSENKTESNLDNDSKNSNTNQKSSESLTFESETPNAELSHLLSDGWEGKAHVSLRINGVAYNQELTAPDKHDEH